MTSFLILPLHVIPAGAEEASRVDTVLFSYLLHVRWPSFGVCQGSASLVVFAYKSFSIGRSWGAAAPGGFEIPHDFQQSLDSSAGSTPRRGRARRCSHST